MSPWAYFMEKASQGMRPGSGHSGEHKMKRLFWLLAIIVLVQCEKQSTEPEIKYYEVEYLVESAGDTTSIRYLDENEESQSIKFANDERHKTLAEAFGGSLWRLKFKVKKGASLFITAQSYGEPFSQYFPVVYVWCYIYVDGGAAVAHDAANCSLGESTGSSGEGCTYWEHSDHYLSWATASYKILK